MGGKEKIWFITGCSTGFGRALAKETIAAGYKVAVTARDKTKIEDLAAGSPENAIALTLDVPSGRIGQDVPQLKHTLPFRITGKPSWGQSCREG